MAPKYDYKNMITKTTVKNWKNFPEKSPKPRTSNKIVKNFNNFIIMLTIS